MPDHPNQRPTLFTYGTGVSLRDIERRNSRAPLIVAVLLLTAAIAALVVAGVLWLATADYGSLYTVALDALSALTRRG